MNLLIIGGLLALGLLAIVGAVFLAMGEKRAAAPSPSATAKTTQPLKQPTGAAAAKMPATKETLPAVREETPLVLNGQYHELANELHALHGRASELEQRLSALTEIADHIEHTRAGSVSIEEDQESAS
ncbi:MAG: hypothetical protein AUG82_05045 [Ktedonobacter sp. 13_1_20CM_4_53_11]|nr:MAG: hypothetical protein AUG82_05045 [Ktedonobacter sp. 13_1_20CM_4_53_11]